MRGKKWEEYKTKTDACAACQCHDCMQLDACTMHRIGVIGDPRDPTPYPCRGCRAAGNYRPFVGHTSVAVCQLYIPMRPPAAPKKERK